MSWKHDTCYPRNTGSPENLPRDNAWHEVTETDTENAEPDPGMIQSVVEHQGVPKEDAIVKPVKGQKNQHRGG
jgi:hypothetical protein